MGIKLQDDVPGMFSWGIGRSAAGQFPIEHWLQAMAAEICGADGPCPRGMGALALNQCLDERISMKECLIMRIGVQFLWVSFTAGSVCNDSKARFSATV